MCRWEAAIPAAVSIERAVSVMPPPQVWQGRIHRAPPPSPPFPPSSVVVAPPTPPPPQKKWVAVVLFPLRQIEQGMKPPPTGRGGTCCLLPSPPSGCDPTTEVAWIRLPRRRTRAEMRRLFGIGTGDVHTTGEAGQRDVLHPQRQRPSAASNRRGNL